MRDTAGSLPMSWVDRRIAIAIVAMGGQGGGVLADWLVALAERHGWIVQSTSVPGVAQRTGATIYYVEMFTPGAHESARAPVLALMPGAGDVDLVVAAEWMEAGRAIVRGLVTPDRTTLIASTHRSYATVEKVVPGNGMADPRAVGEAAALAARRLVAFDMAALASAHRTVISAPLFGAIAACGVLPFPLESFIDAVREGGVGVDSSLAGLHAAYAQAGGSSDQATAGSAEKSPEQTPQQPPVQAQPVPKTDSAHGPASVELPDSALGRRIGELPGAAHRFALEGARRCVDYLDADYADDYLRRLEWLAGRHRQHDQMLAETARWLALRLCYEDPFRVADQKTRRSRQSAIREEIRLAPGQRMMHTEFMHPRLAEILDSLPQRWADRISGSRLLSGLIERRVAGGLLLRSSSLPGFITVWVLARLGRWRRATSRHAREIAQIDDWLARIDRLGSINPSLGTAVARSARLIKGYGDTHARGMALQQRILTLAEQMAQRPDAGPRVEALIEAALADADGRELDRLQSAA